MQTTEQEPRKGQDQLVSFLWIRRSIGALGMLFPILLLTVSLIWGDCQTILPSISAYYHTIARDVFVGVLWMIAVFLFTYRGYDSKDNVFTNWAAFFAVGVSVFPTDKDLHCIKCPDVFTWNTAHYASAIGFFLSITYISYCLFPKSSPDDSCRLFKKDDPTISPERKKRNQVFRGAAVVMLSSIIIIAVFNFFGKNLPLSIQKLPITFIFEWVALWAFGISWIVKGEWLLEK